MFFRKSKKTQWVAHINPDGSEGGRVALSAQVGENVTIGKTARVLPGAKVPDNTIIELGVFYTPDGPVKLTT
tara:strand:+ start:1161 stop:1376 length:216 start_codon:yes stop_codon:yes gene_type:complete